MKRGFCKKWIKQTRLVVALIVFWAVFFQSVPTASAAMSQQTLRCDTGTSIGVDTTNFTCTTASTPYDIGLLLDKTTGTSTAIRIATAGNGPWAYAYFINNTAFPVPVRVTAYSASIPMRVSTSGRTNKGWYELGYYNPNGVAGNMPVNFVGLFNSTIATTTSTTQSSFAISFNGKSAVIPAGYKLAVRVWINVSGSTDRPYYYSFSTATNSNSSFIVDITPLTAGTTYNISGYVTNKSSGQPLSGATVRTNTSLTTTANAAGFYNFTGLSNGTYVINASLTGYAVNSINVAINGAHNTTANISLTTVPTYQLSGYVTNASNGQAITGATVTTDTGLFTSTDGTGYYSFTVGDGTYIITASKPGYSGNSTTQTINGAAVNNANILLTLVPLSIGGKILVATNRFVVLDDPTTGTPDTGSGFTNPGSSWGTTNWIGKNTIINATALYMYDNGTPVSGKVINFTLYRYGGTQVNTIARTTDINGLANYSYDLNLNNYYGNWRVSASSGDIGANTTFIYNWWGCTISVTGCSGHSSKSLTTGATINSPYLSGRDGVTGRNSQHTATGTACTYCHQSFDGKPGGQTSITNHTNFPSDVHRNIACDNVNCHNTKTVHSTNAVIGSCYNSACHTPANRSDISNKSTLNSAALSLYSYANGSIFNASFHTPNSTVPCIICHGPMHNISKPDESLRFVRNNNTEDSQCKTCHSSYNEHNSSNISSGGINCTLCHSDDVHDIQVFSQNATYVDLNHNNPNPARGDCSNCHQNATFFDALKAQPKAGKYTGRNPPQIQVPLNHSTDPYAGALWNGAQSRYWDNTSQLSACYYCHGLTTLHAISALGSIGSVKGTNNLNQGLTNSTWCANCHYKNAPGFGGNQFSLPPPEILNQSGLVPAISGDGTSFYNHSGAVSSSYDDATCKNCHDNNLNAGATSLNFSHNVGRGQAGGANCTGCHNIGGSAGAGKLVNISAMNDTNAIHSGLNSGAITSLPAENKKCWACHGNGSEPGSSHPSTYKNPYRCPDCHVPDAGQNLKFTPNNTLLSVTQHYGNGTSISTSAAASCYDCHNKTEMMLSANLDPDGAGSVYGGANGGSGSASHYARKRADYPAQGTNDYCNKCHNNLTTVFPFIDNANKTIANHSSGYPSSNPDCADCHQAGRIHNSTLYKPASPMNNNSFCLGCHGYNGTGGTNYTGAVTGFKENHNNAVNCTGCHLNDSRSIHPVKYLQQDGSSFNTSKTNTANCATCHQGGNFSTSPKIPAPMNHSTNPYNGSLWNGTQQGYWSDTQSACVYCHGITLHNASALGNITKIMGTNTINQSLTGSYWCANCHYKNAPDYSGNILNPVPPEVLNMNGLVPVTSGDGTAFYNHSDALSSGFDDSRCKNCHGRELKPGATSLDFSHNLKPSEGGPDCVSCHDVSGNGGPENRKINISAMKLGVHTNLNSNAGNTSVLDPINKACWACHGNGTQPEKHPVNYQNPKPCEYCHVNNNFNATLVYRHYPGSVFSGTVVYDSLNSNRTCVSCHNNSLVANQNINYGGYAPEKLKNASVSHYVVSRTLGESMPSAVTGILPDTRAATGTNFGCNKCHNAGAVGTDYGNARILPSSHNIMGSTGISCQTSCHNSNPQVNMTLHDIKIGMYVGSNGCFSAGCHIQPGTGGRRKR